MISRLPAQGVRASVALSMLAVAMGLAAPRGVADDYVRPAEARLRADVSYLSDDLRGGRGIGTRGIDDAADYIAQSFRESGLKPAPGADGYFQKFTVRGEPRLGKPTSLAVTLPDGGKLEGVEGEDFRPLNVGGSGATEGLPLVFAGFGITAKNEGQNLDYDDYDGIDVKDKVVLILRREPNPVGVENGFSGPGTTTYATFTAKAVNAAEHGAKAVLMVNDAESEKDGDQLLDFAATPRGAAIPFVMIKRAVADKILSAAGQPSLADLETAINKESKPQSRVLEGVKVSAQATIDRGEIAVKNVVGVLEGEGPLADETIIVGAHYDHLGNGGLGSLAFGSRDIHNGADDNASGTATVIELARRLARRPDPLPRRVVFMLFSAEERGLLGSEYYVQHPLYPLDETSFMINFDMVGRLNDDRELTVYGAGTSEGLEPLVEALAQSQGVKAKAVQGTRGEFNQSDHASFYRKDIPVLFFFTGTHPDYHRPSDDFEKINYDGMVRIVDLGELVLLDLARRPDRPKFVKATGAASQPAVGAVRSGHGVYFGSRPNYAFEGEGVKLDGVTEGSPAEKAGLKGGDIIIRFGGVEVTDVETYMNAMSGKKPGDEVDVVVRRDGEEKTLKAKLGERPSRSADE
jgi:hypothetical protein